MKSAFVLPLLVLLAIILMADATATSNSAEAKQRKDTCTDLVQKNHNKGSSSNSDSDSGSGDSGSDESNDSGSDGDGDGDSDSSEGDSSDSGQDDDSDSGSGGNDSGEAHPPVTDEPCDLCEEEEENSTATAVSNASPKPTGIKKPKPHRRFHCTLTDALRNISVILDVEQRIVLEEFIRILEITILIDINLTDIEKVVKCSYAIKHFFSLHIEIYRKLCFEKIGDWGFFLDFEYVSIDLQADISEQVVVLDQDGDCQLFKALRNATQDDPEKYAAVLVLIEELRFVLLDVSLTFAQKMAKMNEHFVLFFELHVEWKDFFLEIEIEGFGSLESFVDVTLGYKRSLTLSLVIGGPSSDCPLLLALDEAVANTSFTITVRNQIKQLRIKLAAYFDEQVDVSLRLSYISAQYWQLILVEPWIVEFLVQVSIEVDGESWGIFYDLLWVSQFCKNSGNCGNLDHGMGTSPPPTTTTVAATTITPKVCGNRPQLIVVNPQNKTTLTDVLTEHYNSWNASTRLGFNTCFNQVRNAIWNNVAFPSPATKITEIVLRFKQYNANNLEKQKVLMNIYIQVWAGTVKDFCDCGNGQ